jgi:hypothetical protein
VKSINHQQSTINKKMKTNSSLRKWIDGYTGVEPRLSRIEIQSVAGVRHRGSERGETERKTDPSSGTLILHSPKR